MLHVHGWNEAIVSLLISLAGELFCGTQLTGSLAALTQSVTTSSLSPAVRVPRPQLFEGLDMELLAKD